MNDHPTHQRGAYADALAQAADDLDDALACIREETRAGRVTPAQAAAERAGLLARHLERLEQLRREHLGDEDEDEDEDDLEPYCATCGATIGHFIGHGPDWRHFRGNGTADSPNVLLDPGHAPEVAWRPAGEGQQA